MIYDVRAARTPRIYIYVYINNMLEIIRNEKIFLLYKNFPTVVVVDSLMALYNL